MSDDRYDRMNPAPDRTPDEVVAAVEKLRAERLHEEANAIKAMAEAKKAEAEARKLEAEAAEAEHKTAVCAHVRAREDEKREKELLGDEYSRIYRFDQTVGSTSVANCARTLELWARQDAVERQKTGRKKPCPIEIVFYSPGGEVISGMALFDHIRRISKMGHHITTVCSGYAASMAGILLQAGDTRVMGKESYILIHEVSFGAGGKIGEVEDEVAFVKKIQSRVLHIFAERSSLTVRQLDNRWKRKDWWLDSDEALELKIVDEVR